MEKVIQNIKKGKDEEGERAVNPQIEKLTRERTNSLPDETSLKRFRLPWDSPEKERVGKGKNISFTQYQWDEESGRSLKKPRKGEESHGESNENRRLSIGGAKRKKKNRAADLIKILDAQMRNLREAVRATPNTKTEIKEIIVGITSSMSQLMVREVLDNLEEASSSKDIIMIEESEEAATQTYGETKERKELRDATTQTEQTPWQIRNEGSAQKIRTKITENRDFEGFLEVSPIPWPAEVYKNMRILEGNPIWSDTEKNIAILLPGEEEEPNKGIIRQFQKRYPEFSKEEMENGHV